MHNKAAILARLHVAECPNSEVSVRDTETGETINVKHPFAK